MATRFVNATVLSRLLGVRPETISRWHRRRLIVGKKSLGDKRHVIFDLVEVRDALAKHCIEITPEALQGMDLMISQQLEPATP